VIAQNQSMKCCYGQKIIFIYLSDLKKLKYSFGKKSRNKGKCRKKFVRTLDKVLDLWYDS